MKRTLYAAGTALCLLLLLTAILCAAVTRMGRDGNLYARCFHAFADTRALGVPPDAYDGIGQALGAYFRGGPADFPYFNQREISHLSDIQQLFALFDKGVFLLLPAALLAIPLLRRPDPKGLLWGFGLTLALILLLAAFIVADFEGAFILMHRLLFTNELWLLNPRTDVLICLMPQAMFVYLAGRLALTVIPVWLVFPTAAMIWALWKTRKKPSRPSGQKIP